MGYYSDPTANMALGNINKEFNRLEKKAKKLRDRLDKGEISEKALVTAAAQFTGIYRHVLTLALEAEPEEKENSAE